MRGCVTDDSCPSGTSCSDEGVCSVSPPFDPDALLAAFAVAELPLFAEESGDGRSFSWIAPADAVVVSCASFTCRPEVGAVVGSTNVDGDVARGVRNGASCASTPVPVRLSAGETSARRYTATLPSSTCADGASCRIADLRVACWAYDETRLLAVSRLLTIPAPALSAMLQPEAGCTSSRVGGRRDDCVLDATSGGAGRLGLCRDGSCRTRCVTALDCHEAPDKDDLGVVYACVPGTVEPTPEGIEAGYLGTCEALPP